MVMSALPPKADMCGAHAHVCFGPKADISSPVVKGFHFLRDVGQRVLDGEVTGIQAMDLRMREILEIGFAALACKEDVVLSPEDYRFGLVASEEGLPLWVKLHVRPVVIEEIKLAPWGFGPVEIVKTLVPVIRADELRPGVTVGVDQFYSVGLQEGFRGFFGLWRPVFPIRA